jgi:hypothetical protein
MLYKEGIYFEPIVLYNHEKGSIKALFEYDTLISETMLHTLFTDIKNKIVEGCKVKPSMPGKYDYRRNVSAKKVIETILSINNSTTKSPKNKNASKVSIIKQIVHYNYKTVGIVAKVNNNPIYIPCHPSPIIIDMDYEYYDSPTLLFDAVDTFNMLTILAKDHNLPCLPIKILITDGTNVTGFITETNQVVPTKQYDYDSNLFVLKDRSNKVISKAKSVIDIKENSEYFSDKDIMKQSVEDIERIITIRNFLLEKNFYNCYRNTFKKYIGQENNGNLRQQLIDMLDTTIKAKTSDTLTQYNTKFEKVGKIVNKVITEKQIEFVIYNSAILNELYKKVKKDITICLSNNKAIALPIKNLMDKSNNKEKYQTKLIDELIRYPRLRDYMLYNKSTTSIDITNYAINDDEVIILEEEMFNNYLTNVVLETKNKYINLNQVGFTKPIISKSYKTNFDINYKNYVEDDETIQVTIQPHMERNVVAIPTDVDKYVSNIVEDTSQTCTPRFNKNKNIISKVFNNYKLNTHLKYYKITAPRIEGIKGNNKENCTWNVIQEIFKDYYNTTITKLDLCKTLVSILKRIHDDTIFVTKPGPITNVPNYYHLLDISHRNEVKSIWSIIEEVEDSQWSHLFTIISDTSYYITEFELYLLCDYFKLPCMIHGTPDKNKPQTLYNKSNIRYYDPLYTTFNTNRLGKKPSDAEIKTIKNNLYTNKNNDSFCYIVGYIQFRLSDYYNREGVKNNMGFNKYYTKEYKIPFDVGLMKNADDYYRINLNKEYIQELIQHSITPTINQYIDIIFKSTDDETSIYEMYKNEFQKFKQLKREKNYLKLKS